MAIVENQAPVEDNAVAPVAPVAEPPSFTWKDKLGVDLSKAPTFQKFEDTSEGLKKAFESHASLEKMLGHDKVPIPKGADDVEGWNRFSKAMGIPDKAESYGLADPSLPPEMKGIQLDKNRFAEIVHAHKLTPGQAKGLWEAYQSETVTSYRNATESFKTQMAQVVNSLKAEWGDTYDANIDLGQTVINKFSGDDQTKEFITALMLKDPRSIKFLAQIGNQFAENKVGDFQMKRFSLAPEEAKEEWNKIVKDPAHPYNNEKSSPRERQTAIDYVNSLIAVASGIKR